jgi:glycine cleavage system H protein
MSNVADNLRYRDSHEWCDPSTDPVTCGISDHAQHELTDVVFVELPKVGRAVAVGEPICTIESVKAANDVYAPISGEIAEVNEALLNDPGLVNRDPYLNGWMFKIKASKPDEIAALMTPDAYRGHIA